MTWCSKSWCGENSVRREKKLGLKLVGESATQTNRVNTDQSANLL